MQFTLISNLSPELIVWEDISACNETWATEDEIETWLSDVADAHVEQVGYVIYEDERIVVVADSQIESMNLFGNVNKIPKACILSRTPLVSQTPVINPIVLSEVSTLPLTLINPPQFA